MKFLSISDFQFTGREGRVVFEVGGLGDARSLERAEKQQLAREGVTRLNELSREVLTPKIEIQMLLDFSKYEKKLESGGSSSDTKKEITETINKISDSSIESFIYTFPEEAKELFTDNLGGDKYKIKFYGNDYLNKQIPLESLFTYKDKFIQKGDNIGVWSANGYIILDKDGNMTSVRLKVFDGDEVKDLSRTLVEGKYPDKYFSSMETDRTVDIRRRINFSVLQGFKDTINKTDFKIEAIFNKYFHNRNVIKLKTEANNVDRSLNPIEYSKKINQIKKIFFEQKNKEEIPLTKDKFNEKIKNMDGVAEVLNKELKSYFDCTNQECDLFVGSLLAIKGIASPFGESLTNIKIKKILNKYIKPEDQNKVEYLIHKISFFNIKKLTTVRNYYSSIGREDTTGAYEEYINKYIENTSMNLSERFKKIKKAEKKEQEKKFKAVITDLLTMQAVFNKGPNDDNPVELLNYVSKLILKLPDEVAQREIGESAVSIVFRLERTYSNMPAGENKEKLGKSIHRVKEMISMKNLEEQERQNRTFLEKSNKDVISLLGEERATEYFDLVKKESIINDHLIQFIEKIKEVDPSINEDEVLDILSTNYSLVIRKNSLAIKRDIYRRLEISIKNKEVISGVNNLFRKLESTNSFFLKFIDEQDGPEYLRIVTLINNEEVTEVKELIDDYLIQFPADENVLKLKELLESAGFIKYVTSIRNLDGKIDKKVAFLVKSKEVANILDSSKSFDDFIDKLEEKEQRGVTKTYVESFPNKDANSKEAQETIAQTMAISSEMPNFTNIGYDTEGNPIFEIGEIGQEVIVDIESNEMYAHNVALKQTMSDRLRFPLEAKHVPGVQLTGAIVDANFWTTDYGVTNSRRKGGQDKFQNMIVQIYPWGTHRELRENEINGWRNLQLELRARGKGMSYFWERMHIVDKNSEVVDEKGGDISSKVRAAVDSARVNNFDWLDSENGHLEDLKHGVLAVDYGIGEKPYLERLAHHMNDNKGFTFNKFMKDHGLIDKKHTMLSPLYKNDSEWIGKIKSAISSLPVS